MKYYRVVVNYGHQGTGKPFPVVRYIYAKNMADCIDVVKRFKGIKRSSVFLIHSAKEVTYDEYMQNRCQNILKTVPHNIGEQFIIDRLESFRKKKCAVS